MHHIPRTPTFPDKRIIREVIRVLFGSGEYDTSMAAALTHRGWTCTPPPTSSAAEKGAG